MAKAIRLPIFRGMSEAAIRKQVVAEAVKWLGTREGTIEHKRIVDGYNKGLHKLPRGYRLQDDDAWCAAFISFIGICLGISGVILPEVGCGPMIELYRKQGRWMERDDYVPSPGDIVMFDWDAKRGECTGAPDHVGMVVSVEGKAITVIEGNYDNQVKYRVICVEYIKVRGYCLPDYASLVWGFADVPAGEWYTPAVDWAEEESIIEGVSERLFAPDQPCTRAHVLTTMYRLFGSVEVKGPIPFADVGSGAYYADAVRWGHKLSITEGLSDVAFGPDEPCTRAQIITMIWRHAGKPVQAGFAPFDDVEPEAFYADAVDWAYGKGIVFGVNDYDFAPDQPCTRAEMVTMLYRYAA